MPPPARKAGELKVKPVGEAPSTGPVGAIADTISGAANRARAARGGNLGAIMGMAPSSQAVRRTACRFARQYQNGGGFGCVGFGPKARVVSRCGRLTFATASCRAYSWSPNDLYWELVSDARKATSTPISGAVNAKGWMSASSHGSRTPSPLL